MGFGKKFVGQELLSGWESVSELYTNTTCPILL